MDMVLAMIPLTTGYILKRWKQTVNVMIEKKKGNYRVDGLRTIMLFEPDFNHNNKWLGRCMMRWAEKEKALAPEQSGSR